MERSSTGHDVRNQHTDTASLNSYCSSTLSCQLSTSLITIASQLLRWNMHINKHHANTAHHKDCHNETGSQEHNQILKSKSFCLFWLLFPDHGHIFGGYGPNLACGLPISLLDGYEAYDEGQHNATTTVLSTVGTIIERSRCNRLWHKHCTGTVRHYKTW